MKTLTFERTNGNIPKSMPGQDHISGLIAYLTTLPSGFTESDRIKAISTIEKAEELGITAQGSTWEIKMLHYQLSQIFRINPAISLFVGLFAKPTGEYSFSEIAVMQNFTGGSLRQLGIWAGGKELTADNLTAIQGVAKTLESQDTPLSVLYAPKITDVTSLPTTLAGGDKRNVSVVIGQAGSGVGAELYSSDDNTEKNTVSDLGVVLGLLSRSSVHESIGWVARFPTGIDLPAFGDGTLERSLDRAIIESLDSARYLFFVTYSGLGGSFVNDSHTMDVLTSDYAMIENVRTMDKAVRGIRTYLLPELGSPLYVDPSNGQLQPQVVEYLKTVANKALEDMEKAGQLSGYIVEIDPDQNVLSTSELAIVIKPVGVGVLRRMRVKIGFTTNTNS